MGLLADIPGFADFGSNWPSCGAFRRPVGLSTGNLYYHVSHSLISQPGDEVQEEFDTAERLRFAARSAKPIEIDETPLVTVVNDGWSLPVQIAGPIGGCAKFGLERFAIAKVEAVAAGKGEADVIEFSAGRGSIADDDDESDHDQIILLPVASAKCRSSDMLR